MSHNELILAHLKDGYSITPIEALSEYGCFRLSARIWDLRDMGHDIKMRRIDDPKTGKHFAEYYLPEKVSA